MNNHQHVPDLHRCSKPSRWWQPPRDIRIPQQMNTQVPTRCKLTSKCTWDHSISLWLGKQAREMSGRGCAQLKGVLEWSTSQAMLQRAGQHVFIDVPLRIEPLGTRFCCSRADRTRWSNWPNALVAHYPRAKLDRTRWSRKRSNALLDEPDAIVPAFSLSPVSTHHDWMHPVERDRTRHHVRLEDQDACKHWTLTGRVRSNRDRVRSPLWPPFAFVWFTLSHMS
jgi:hypothetical protein